MHNEDTSQDQRSEGATEHSLKPFDIDDNVIETEMSKMPIGSGNMLDLMLNIIHVAEVYSPHRVTILAAEHGLSPGAAFDITISDKAWKPYNFDDPEQRLACKR